MLECMSLCPLRISSLLTPSAHVDISSIRAGYRAQEYMRLNGAIGCPSLHCDGQPIAPLSLIISMPVHYYVYFQHLIHYKHDYTSIFGVKLVDVRQGLV
jgi:hypothetical protein